MFLRPGIGSTFKFNYFSGGCDKCCSMEILIIDIKSNMYYFFTHRRLLVSVFGSSFELQIEVPIKC